MDYLYFFPQNRPPTQLVSFLPPLCNTSSPLLSACVYIPITCLVPLLEAECLLMLVCGLCVCVHMSVFTHSILPYTFNSMCPDIHGSHTWVEAGWPAPGVLLLTTSTQHSYRSCCSCLINMKMRELVMHCKCLVVLYAEAEEDVGYTRRRYCCTEN